MEVGSDGSAAHGIDGEKSGLSFLSTTAEILIRVAADDDGGGTVSGQSEVFVRHQI